MVISRLLLLILLIVVGGAPPALALEPEVMKVADEIADRTEAAMQPLLSKRDFPKVAAEPNFTTSLTLLQRGFQPPDTTCAPALRSQFEKQVKALARDIRRPIRILPQGIPATAMLVIGDVIGKQADLSDMPFNKWADDTKRASDQDLSARAKALDLHAGNTSVLSGLYRSADGALVHGSGVFDWDSSYVYFEQDQPVWNCRFNFVQKIVWLSLLDVNERLRAELLEIESSAGRRSGADDDPDPWRGVRVRTEIGYLTTANLFCLQMAEISYSKQELRACAVRVASSMMGRPN